MTDTPDDAAIVCEALRHLPYAGFYSSVFGIVDQAEALSHFNRIIAERDKLRAERIDGWQPIETAPIGDELFMTWCPGGSPFIVRGNILANARLPGTPAHLSMRHMTHWRPLPVPPCERRKA
jgi:hypothetical protein